MLEIVYVPSAAVVAEVTMALDFNTSTVAPDTGLPVAAAVTVPVTDPLPIENVIALLATPPSVTTKDPLVAAAGTVVTMAVFVQLAGDAGAPLKVTVLEP